MINEEYIKKWLEGTLSDAELDAFKRTKDYESLMKLDTSVQQFKAPDYDVQTELNLLKAKKRAKGREVKINWLPPMLRIAAVVALALLGYYFIFFNSTIKVNTGIAQKAEIQLPDNSTVMINALSSLSYVEKTWQEQREVKLSGEAYFRVAKGSRFDVKTSDGIISVLGTQFNVKVRDNYFEVVCFEGLVAVESNQGRVELPPNHMFRIVDGHVFRDEVLSSSAPSWLRNESSFSSVPYKFIIKELERQYDIKITTENVDLEQLFTGRFTHENLSVALKSISLPLNLQYKIVDGNKIELLGDIK